MSNVRRQLTLFASDPAKMIEGIRSEFNPEQFRLISAHVTLCREDEISELDAVLDNVKKIKRDGSLTINFGPARRFSEGRGVLIPGTGRNKEFEALREETLGGLVESIRRHEPHITLMHPRNSTCTDKIFEQIQNRKLPVTLDFSEISLIEQRNGKVWKIVQTFPLSK